MTVHRQAEGHVVDAMARKQAIGMVIFGVGFFILGAVWVIGNPIGIIGLVLGAFLAVSGIALRRTPTADARIAVQEAGVDVALVDGTIRIPWEDIDHWGLARRRLLEANQLVLWPVAEPSAPTVEAAKRLWSGRRHGWALCFSDPPPELVREFTDSAARPRHDGAARAPA